MAASTLKWTGNSDSINTLRNIAEATLLSESATLAPIGELSGVRGRIQVIWGREDKIAPVAHAGLFPPNVSVYLVNDAGHLPHMEAPKEVNRLLVDALTS